MHGVNACYYKAMNIYRRGFTLIELLVVIAIIGILSTIVFANFMDARADAQNKSLRAELNEVRLALEVYKAQNGSYPTTAEGLSTLIPDYISTIPDAATAANTNCNLEYAATTGGAAYKLTALRCIGGDVTVSVDDEFARCPNYCGSCPASAGTPAFDESIAVYSAGAECS